MGYHRDLYLAAIIQYIYINYLFYQVNETSMCNFADDTTSHASGDVLNDVMIQLEHDSNTLLGSETTS